MSFDDTSSEHPWDRVPAELRNRDQWLCWRREERGSRPTKVPICAATGKLARVNDPTTWSSFEVARRAQTRFPVDGIGFVFTAGDLCCGIDLDNALDADGGPKVWAQAILDLPPAGSYIEISPSGKGLHIILLGKKPTSRFRTSVGDGALEVYDRDRYFTVSGVCFGALAGGLVDGQAAIDQICARFLNDDRKKPRLQGGFEDSLVPLLPDDQRLMQKAFASKGGDKIRSLWTGECNSYPSQSEADLALCSHLCHWTKGDLRRVDRIFRLSGLMRPKWDERADYRHKTLALAAQRPESRHTAKVAAPDSLGSRGAEGSRGPKQAMRKAITLTADEPGTIENTHLGNAQRLAARFGDRLRFVPGLGFLVYEGGVWHASNLKAEGLAANLSRLISAEVAQACHAAVEAQGSAESRSHQTKADQLSRWALKSEQGPTIRESLKLAGPLLALDAVKLDAEPLLLNLRNGTLNLKTGQVRRQKSRDFLTQIAPTKLQADVNAPRWIAFIDQIMGRRPEKVRFLQKALGYSMTGLVSEQCLFICYGTGQNGKSTLLEVVGKVLGSGYVSRAAPDLLMAQPGAAHPASIADLRGARLVVCQEVGTAKTFDAQRLKEMTGEQTLKARQMYGDWFEFPVQFKIWLMANELPRTSDQSSAFWRRIRLIKFESTIGEPIRNFDRHLLEESSGILNWLLEGARLYLAEGLEPPEEISSAATEYRQETNTVARFVDECCQVGERLHAKASDLQVAYEKFARESGLESVSRNAFGPELAKQGFPRLPRRNDGIYYSGLRLRQESNPRIRSAAGESEPREPLLTPFDKLS